MLTNTRLRRALTVAAVLFARDLAGSPLPSFALAARTERGSYFTSGKNTPDVRRIEEYVSELATRLGTAAPQSRYFLYESPSHLAEGTGHYTAGVTFPQRAEVHSTMAFHRHELVHLVAAGLGDPGRFFQEGLAVALGDEARWRGKKVHQLARRLAGERSMAQLIEGFEAWDPEAAYPVAGSFVAWLIDTQGLERVSTFFRLSARTDRAFEEAFGMGLEEAGRGWRRAL